MARVYFVREKISMEVPLGVTVLEVVGDCQVEIPGKKKRGKILSEGFSRNVNFQPDLRVKRIRLEKPEIWEKRSEWERLLAAV